MNGARKPNLWRWKEEDRKMKMGEKEKRLWDLRGEKRRCGGGERKWESNGGSWK